MTQVVILEGTGKGRYTGLVTDLASERYHELVSVKGRNLTTGDVRDLPVPAQG